MTLASGSRLGPYEIVAPLGAGGMGEVYRARDTRLGREVAIKVLPPAFADDPERLARFEREARLLAQLHHPNIATIFGVEESGSVRALVMELVEGPTLAARLERGRLPLAEALGVARQIAEALECAHEKGIVHRDLKPQNVKGAEDGAVKVLDFGLAKATAPASSLGSTASELAQSPTITLDATRDGTILGTAAYMSPEQARGASVDRRTDIWAFGAVLYELLAGRRLFDGPTVPDVLSAILRAEIDLDSLPPEVPGAIRRLLRRCLERNPKNRLHDIADARLILDEVLQGQPDLTAPTAGPTRRVGAWAATAALGVAALAALGGFVAGRTGRAPASPAGLRFERLTFRQGHFVTARFAPDGQTVLYAAAWEGRPRELFQARPGSGGELSLGLSGAELLAVSRAGELALLLPKIRTPNPYWKSGTLALVPASGGTPRPLAEEVVWADFFPDGKSLAVIRMTGGGRRLEAPIGNALYSVPHQDLAWIRVSPDGERIAAFEREGGLWSVVTFDRAGERRVVSAGWLDWWNLAWAPGGGEIWFGAMASGAGAALRAVDLAGRVRDLLEIPGTLELQDVGPDGRALVGRVEFRSCLFGKRDGAPREVNLAWLDSSSAADLSEDGSTLLIDEESERERGAGGVYLRAMDGAPAVRLGDGVAQDLSADGRWALALRPTEIVALPAGAGEPRRRTTPFAVLSAARFLPGNERFVAAGVEPGGSMRLYVAGFGDDPPRPIGGEIHPRPPGTFRSESQLALSPDGGFVAYADTDGSIAIVRLDDGTATRLPGTTLNEIPARWSADGRGLYVFDPGELPARLDLIDVATGDRRHVLEVSPLDRVGVAGIPHLVLSADATSYAYDFARFQSYLYLAEGLK